MQHERCRLEVKAATMRYPVNLTKDDNQTYLVTFPDVPEAVTFGDTKEEALVQAHDALLTALDACIRHRKNIPSPSAARGDAFVELPALETTKIELYRAMRQHEVGKAELARRLEWHLPQVDRVLNVRHGSQLDQLEAAFGALGKKLILNVVDVEGAGRPKRKGPRMPRRNRVPGPIVTTALAERGLRRHVADAGRRTSAPKRGAKKR